MAKAPTHAPTPVHPGAILDAQLDHLYRQNILPRAEVAERLGVSSTVLDNLLTGKTSMTPSMAMRLERLLGAPTAAEWMASQAAYDLWKAEPAMASMLAAIKPLPKRKR